MSVSETVLVTLVCDRLGCRETVGPKAAPRAWLRQQAARKGWVHVARGGNGADDLDYCRAHQQDAR